MSSKQETPGIVYLLCDSGQDNLFKIGVTRGSIEKRIKKLQTGNGNEIFLVGYHKSDHPFYIEHMLHQKYFPKQKLNEWFEMENYFVSDFQNDCEFYENLIIEMKDNFFFQRYL